MIRRRSNNPFTSPVLVGALAVLVMVVGCVFAFQANNGLPFVPRYTLYIQARNAEELVHGSEIHMGGALIGTISKVAAERLPDGTPVAVIDAQINKSASPLPVDTKFVIRLKSTIGEKYLDVQLGHAKQTWANGATVPYTHTSAMVDLDQVLDMYTPKTQTGVQATTNGFAQALAGRGADLNSAIGAFVPLVKDLTPVAQNLASKTTNLKGFIEGLASFTGALAPVADQDASMWTGLDTTFKALASVSKPYLQQWIAQTPATEQSLIDDGPTLDRFITKTATIFADLKPGLATLPQSAPAFAAAISAGVRTLPSTARFDQQLPGLAEAIDDFGQDSIVTTGLSRLQTASKSLVSPLSFLTPVQTVCNYPALFLRNMASALSDNVGTGTVLRVVIVAIDNGLTNGEAGPSSSVYTTPQTKAGHNHGPLHVDPYPNTASPGETDECSAGNESYSGSAAVIGNPSGNVGTHTQSTSVSGG